MMRMCLSVPPRVINNQIYQDSDSISFYLTKVQKPFFEPSCLILKLLYDADKVSQLQTGVRY
jgi:hypothetical protein